MLLEINQHVVITVTINCRISWILVKSLFGGILDVGLPSPASTLQVWLEPPNEAK